MSTRPASQPPAGKRPIVDSCMIGSVPATSSSPPEGEQSQLRRGLSILELVALAPRTAADVARELSVHRSTALRLLQELEAVGYVKRRSTKEYVLSAERILSLVPEVHEESDLLDVIHPLLLELRDRFGEAVNFSIPGDETMIYMAYVSSPQMIAVRERIGTIRPMHCSAIGKAFLAALPADSCKGYLERLTYRGGTKQAPRNKAQLLDELDQTRSRGYALDLEESLPDVVCVASAVSFDGHIVGAAGITAPASRRPRKQLDEYGQQLADIFLNFGGQVRRSQTL